MPSINGLLLWLLLTTIMLVVLSQLHTTHAIKRSELVNALDKWCSQDKLNITSFDELNLFIKYLNALYLNKPNKIPPSIEPYLNNRMSVLLLKRLIRLDNVCHHQHLNDMVAYHEKYIDHYEPAPVNVIDLFTNYANQVNLLCSARVNQRIKDSEWLVKNELNELCNLAMCHLPNYEPSQECNLGTNTIRAANFNNRVSYEKALVSYINRALNYRLGGHDIVAKYTQAFKSLMIGSCLRLEQLYTGVLRGVIRLSDKGYATNSRKLDKKSVDKWTQIMDLCDMLLHTDTLIETNKKGQETISFLIKAERAYDPLEPINFVETLDPKSFIFNIE